MNNSCISHLRISDADQIQIVVSRFNSGGGKLGGTDITIQALNREKRLSRPRKLPPLQISDYPEQQLLSPRRIPSPSPSRCSPRTFRACSQEPMSPNSPSVSGSRFHQSCLTSASSRSRPTSPTATTPTTLPYLKGSGIPVLLSPNPKSRTSSPNAYISSSFRNRKGDKKVDEDSASDEIPDWKIEQYLLNNPEFVDTHVSKYWDRYKFTQRDYLDRQKTLNEFLLSMVRSIFQDMVSMDTVIKKVMNFAQKLVDADRASLFLIDSRSGELYARIFDMGGGRSLDSNNSESANSSNNTIQISREIRFKIGTGIAGRVAQTGETLNIADAYDDPRFNRNIDQVTGYVTRSILCMPIFIRGSVMGVVQMVNKNSGVFNEEDVDAFETFAVYCGLALHHAKLYDKIRRSEQKFKVALEVLSYHNTCTDDEFETFRATGPASEPPSDLVEFSFLTLNLGDAKRINLAIHMFIDLFGLTRFNMESLYRFVITVKKNYRKVPYHNWAHGFTVAHSMYCILKKSDVFKPLECLALYVGCLCHDLDHRGKNNQFMQDTASPLASIYTTSTLEHHHFNQTISILQQDGLNIFSKLSSEEYKQVLGNLKHCILATDLALYFSNKAKLTNIVGEDKFSWNNSDHRLLAQAIAMTAADLCASAKPWEAQVETVRVIFEEFYEQGDIEKLQGRKPLPMMDRDQADQLPSSQVGFLSVICIPCYDVLGQLVPTTRPLLEGCQKNLEQWKAMVESQNSAKEANKVQENEESKPE